MKATPRRHRTKGIHDHHGYHPAPRTMSYSRAKTILEAPAKVWAKSTPTDAMDEGTICHKLVLGKGADIAIIDAPDWRTKAAQEARDTARREGRIPCLPETYANAERMADAALSTPSVARALEAAPLREATVYADAGTHWMRAGVDALGPGVIAVDYKTTVDASPRGFAGAVAKYRYFMQAAFTLDTLDMLGIAPQGGFLFIAQEKTAPYLPCVYQLEAHDIDRGRVLYKRATATWLDCLKTGVWPGYMAPNTVATLTLPGWIHRDEAEVWEEEIA